MTTWTKDKEKRILMKYRFILTIKVVRIIIACLLSFWLYMIIITIVFDQMNIDKRHEFNSNLALDWKEPNIYNESGGWVESEITPFFTQKISYPVSRTVGRDGKVVGEMVIKKRIITPYSSREIKYFNPKDKIGFQFYLPEHPQTKQKLSGNGGTGVWETLDKVHEGTVADFAFSFDQYKTPEEAFKLLEPYDIDVLWMPLYTGELKEFKISYTQAGGGNDQSLSLGDIYGFTGGRELSNDRKSESKMGFQLDDVELNQNIMLRQMKNLIENESSTYNEQFLGLTYLEERYQYLKKNGFKVYGAVITGPVKELLKLKDLQHIRGAQVGEMNYWNWEY